MKKFRTTFILTGILVVLLLIVVFFASDSAEQKRNDSQTDKPVLKERQINQFDQIVFDSAQGKPVMLQKNDDHWVIDGVMLDRDEEEKLLTSLKDFATGKVISKSQANWDKYGLLEETSSVITLSSEGKEVSKFYIGSVGPSYQSVYVRRGSDESVYLVNTGMDDFLQYDVNRWKNKKLILAEKGDIRAVTVRIGEKKWLFEQQSSKWGWIKDGKWTEIEGAEAFESYLDGLLSLKAEGIEPDSSLFTSADNAIAFSLDDGKEYIVSMDVVDDAQTLVMITDQPDVLRFSSDLSARLRPEFLESPETSPEASEETSLSTESIPE